MKRDSIRIELANGVDSNDQNSNEFARILYNDKIETPVVYFRKQNMGIWKSKEEFPNPYNWSRYIVGQILSKPEYMGDTVNFHSHKASYKDKSSIPNSKEDWLILMPISW